MTAKHRMHILQSFCESSFGSFLLHRLETERHLAVCRSIDAGAALFCEALEETQAVHLWFKRSDLLIGSHLLVVSGVSARIRRT